ncbi:MAG: ROK family protein [Proteobacteria bacterium]|nr:ROK family protein [Pseudomonadota bacterium]MCP4919331.1 ROK family protein [Pseudomonadota bacterium]
MTTLETAFRGHRRHPRARRWRVGFSLGHGAGAAAREIELRAPASAKADLVWRIHNGILLLQPAAVRVPEGIEVSVLREIHRIPIASGDQPVVGLAEGTLDLPAIEESRGGVRSGLAVGLDIGGTGMKACALRDGKLVAKAHARTWPEGEHGIESLVSRARALVLEVADGPVGSLGIGFASPMGLGGQVVALSTVMRERLGGVEVVADFPHRVADGICSGPVACYNDLANLGRHLSGKGRRRLLRLQIGTSFGGCWLDADGTVNAVELGRLVVDASPDARPHTYLPLKGAMKSYLSGLGVGWTLGELLGEPVDAWRSGYALAELLRAGRPEGRQAASWIAELLVGAIQEARVFLPGIEEIEVGGSMLQGASGRAVRTRVEELLDDETVAPRFRIAADPGYDGALAAAEAPLLDTPLRGLRRLTGR